EQLPAGAAVGLDVQRADDVVAEVDRDGAELPFADGRDVHFEHVAGDAAGQVAFAAPVGDAAGLGQPGPADVPPGAVALVARAPGVEQHALRGDDVLAQQRDAARLDAQERQEAERRAVHHVRAGVRVGPGG